MLKLYADESMDDSTSLINVSGYLMTEDQHSSLDARVKEVRGELPYFHMKEGHHLKYPSIYQGLVDLIKPNSVLCGISISFFRNDFEQMMSLKFSGQSLKYWLGGLTTYGIGAMMALCAGWLNQSQLQSEYVAYVFENCPGQGDANTFWGMLAEPKYAERRQMYHYASHSFVDGKGPLGSVLQLCDVLAWNLNKMERKKRKSPELKRLFRTTTIYRHHGPAEIAEGINRSIDHWNLFDRNGNPFSAT